jgi:hypothetical protein
MRRQNHMQLHQMVALHFTLHALAAQAQNVARVGMLGDFVFTGPVMVSTDTLARIAPRSK